MTPVPHFVLASLGATALALARINGEARDSGIQRIGASAFERLAAPEKAKFERCVAEAEMGLLEAFVASRSG